MILFFFILCQLFLDLLVLYNRCSILIELNKLLKRRFLMSKGRKKSQDNSQLTQLETDVMQVIWKNGNATAAEIRSELHNSRPLADTTIHTVLSNLRKKGIIKPVPTIERALRFAPKITREKIGGKSLKILIREFFGNSPGRLMAHLINEEKVDSKELVEIRSMLDSYKKKGGRKS
jgi:BlaI family transcriptional regulator, penicillinase repressor